MAAGEMGAEMAVEITVAVAVMMGEVVGETFKESIGRDGMGCWCRLIHGLQMGGTKIAKQVGGRCYASYDTSRFKWINVDSAR